MSDTTDGRRKFMKLALVSAGAAIGSLGASTLAFGEEVKIGRLQESLGFAKAAGTCGIGGGCAGR